MTANQEKKFSLNFVKKLVVVLNLKEKPASRSASSSDKNNALYSDKKTATNSNIVIKMLKHQHEAQMIRLAFISRKLMLLGTLLALLAMLGSALAGGKGGGGEGNIIISTGGPAQTKIKIMKVS